MSEFNYKTISANKNTVRKDWYVVDAEDQITGRLASKIANIIRGKHKPYFTPHVDCGDQVIVINAEKIRFTGKKLTQKQYIRHTGYPGGQRQTNPKELLVKKPTEILASAVKGMLPKNKLQKVFMKNLHIFEGTEHPHSAQKPKKLEL